MFRIGASEVPTLFGVNPFQTIEDLFLIKLGKKEKPEGNAYTRIGTLLEDDIISLYREMTGYEIKQTADTYSFPVSDDIELVCKLDAIQVLSDKEWIPIEVKFTTIDEAKDYYFYQMLAQLICVNKPYGILIMATPTSITKDVPYRTICVEIENRDREKILEKVKIFGECLKSETIDYNKFIPETETAPNTEISIIEDADIEGLCSEYIKVNAQIKALERKKEEISSCLKQKISDGQTLVSNNYEVKWITRHIPGKIEIDNTFGNVIRQIGIPFLEREEYTTKYIQVLKRKIQER